MVKWEVNHIAKPDHFNIQVQFIYFATNYSVTWWAATYKFAFVLHLLFNEVYSILGWEGGSDSTMPLTLKINDNRRLYLL